MTTRQQPDAKRSDTYRELFERSSDAILIIEGKTFVDCNEATVRMLRCKNRAEVLQTHPSELSPPLQPDGRRSYEKAQEMIALAFERGSHRFEWNHQRADGEVFPVEVLLTALNRDGRRTLHVVWRDITRRKQLEEELRHAQKMEAIGKLTGGIAHDFNNLLVAVLGNADLLQDLVAEQPEALEHVHAILEAGERAADLVRQLLAFGRRQHRRPVRLDLNELIRGMEALIQQLVGENVRLTYRLSSQPMPIEADRSQIEQVLLNLASNARDALPNGGEIVIETASIRRGADDQCVLLRVRDDGVGMDETVAERAFDPFFTTKHPGKGTGLGLATVYGIARQSGGTATLHSVVGGGTTVDVLLPRCEGPIPTRDTQLTTRPDASGGDETILVVEDEAMVADLARRTLETNGYRVLVARDGKEAQALYLEQGRRIDLLLTDVIMPRASGPELVSTLRALGHLPHVLFMSGYTDDRLAPFRDEHGEIEILPKPFTAAQLLTRVRSALDELPSP